MAQYATDADSAITASRLKIKGKRFITFLGYRTS
jgi:hypothetical protein